MIVYVDENNNEIQERMLAERRHEAYRKMADQQIMEVMRTMMTISVIKAPLKEDIDDIDISVLSTDPDF